MPWQRLAEPYFLGPFVYHEERRNVRFLVDGQQRFTTLHLIFIHLYRQACALGRKDAEDKLYRVIRFMAPNGAWRFRIDIEERRQALQRWYDNGDYHPNPACRYPSATSLLAATSWASCSKRAWT